MRTNQTLLVVLFVLSVAAANAQEPVDWPYDKVLLPISARILRGASGTEWSTLATITNLSSTPIKVFGYTTHPPCPSLCPPYGPIPPGATIFGYGTGFSPEGIAGDFLLVERGRVSDLAITLRTQDLSRQRETWGTSIPVVSERELFSSRFGLVDVPVEAQFRSTLRIYDFDPFTLASVRVRFYGVNRLQTFPDTAVADQLLFEVTPTFIVSEFGKKKFPGYAEIALWQHPEVSAVDRLRIEIEPLTGEKDYWAFVSVTHNETQHVTIVAPK